MYPGSERNGEWWCACRPALAVPLLTAALLVFPASAFAAKIRFYFDGWSGPEIRVYLTRPAGLAAGRPVVFVMPGDDRDASAVRDRWHDLALEHDFLLVVPEFRERDFSGASAYPFGNVFTSEGKANPERLWVFSVIEPLFDEVRRRYSISAGRYAIYGKGAGAEFVSRYLFYVPEARLACAVAARAVLYPMPDSGVDYPFGLRGSSVPPGGLEAALQRHFTLLLEGGSESLERTASGQAFFDDARGAAAELGVEFGWQLVTVPEGEALEQAALPYLLYTPKPAPQDDEALPARLPQTGM